MTWARRAEFTIEWDDLWAGLTHRARTHKWSVLAVGPSMRKAIHDVGIQAAWTLDVGPGAGLRNRLLC